VVLTFETESLAGEEKNISFSENTEADLNCFIKRIGQYYHKFDQFEGTSIHHLSS
jgi:hypothetical protein